jgi:hypothetical protein
MRPRSIRSTLRPARSRACAELLAIAAACVLLGACGRSPGTNKPRFDVLPVTLKDASSAPLPPAEVPVLPANRPALLSIPIPGHMGASALEARLLDEKEEVVWVGVGLRRTESGNGFLLLPAGFLHAGSYTLAVGRAQPGVNRGQFPFRVD